MAALGRGTPQERTRLWQVPSFPSFSSFDHFHPALTLGAQPPMHRLPTFRTSLRVLLKGFGQPRLHAEAAAAVGAPFCLSKEVTLRRSQRPSLIAGSWGVLIFRRFL